MAFTWFFGLTMVETFDGLRAYVGSLDKALHATERREWKRLQAKLPRLDAEEGDHLEYIHDELYRGRMPRNFLNSCVLLLVAEIESLTATLCRDLAKTLSIRRITTKELKQPAKVRTYLHRVAGLPLKKDPFERRLGSLRVVRNCIAHSGGDSKVTTNPAHVRDAATSLGFKIRHHGEVVINARALRALIDASDEWLHSIYGPTFVRMRDYRDGQRPRRSAGRTPKAAGG